MTKLKGKRGGDPHLNWLLDFKVGDILKPSEASKQRKRTKASTMATESVGVEDRSFAQGDEINGSQQLSQDAPSSLHLSDFDSTMASSSNPEDSFTVDLSGIDDVANFEQVDVTDSFQFSEETLRKEGFDLPFEESVGKPRCTYTDLIERALTGSRGLTVSEIYQWISDHHSFFRPDDDRWKNSVRHNLSINPYFKKGAKARNGAGHLWTISEESRALKPSAATYTKPLEFEELIMPIENDDNGAVADILRRYQQEKHNMEGKKQGSATTARKMPESESLCTPPYHQVASVHSAAEEPLTSIEVHREQEEAIANITDASTNDFERNPFEHTGYTIDLASFHFTDANSLSFDDLMPGTSLIVIQTEEQDANKENMNNTEMDHAEFSMRQYDEQQASQITATERLSSQLISEALTQDFKERNESDGTINETGRIIHLGPPIPLEEPNEPQHLHQLEGGDGESTQQYLTLDSIDHLALQEVIQGSGMEMTSLEYQLMPPSQFGDPNAITFTTQVSP